MNNEKVKEIKKALECWQESVMLSTDENYVSHKVYNREILDYINELESENERIKNIGLNEDITVIEWLQENQHLKDRIAELEKEIEENAFYSKGYAQGIKNTYEVVMPDKLKQFGKKLKEKFYYEGRICRYIIDSDVFDETLKEFIDD